MSQTIKRLKNQLRKCKYTFESKGFKVYLVKAIVMVNGDITKDGLTKNKVDQCDVCSLRVKAKTALCVQCGKWINSRCDE